MGGSRFPHFPRAELAHLPCGSTSRRAYLFPQLKDPKSIFLPPFLCRSAAALTPAGGWGKCARLERHFFALARRRRSRNAGAHWALSGQWRSSWEKCSPAGREGAGEPPSKLPFPANTPCNPLPPRDLGARGARRFSCGLRSSCKRPETLCLIRGAKAGGEFP